MRRHTQYSETKQSMQSGVRRTVWAVALLLCTAILIDTEVHADQNEVARAKLGAGGFFQHQEEGWFWYQDPREAVPPAIPEAPEDEPPAAQPGQPELKKPGVEPFSAAWLRENMPRLLDRAINDPTEKNVKAYEYAKRVMLDRAQRYAEMTRHVIANDPNLDENNRVPFATFAKQSFLRTQKAELGKAMTYLSEKAGIWMFFDSTCDFCHIQAQTVLKVSEDFGFITRFISVNGQGLPMLREYYDDNGWAKALGLKMTPTTVLVVPPDKFYIVSQGAMAEDQLQERILVAADSNGLLPEEFQKGTRAYSKGLFTTEDLADGAESDPDVWLQLLQDRLEVRN